ncbi:MAG: diadenylate cyclase CdaA [Gemmatimonadaceae bacterium]
MSIIDQFWLVRFGWRDAAEIVVVAVVLYRVLLLFHGTRAVQILLGVVILVVVYAAAWALKLGTISYLLGLVLLYGPLAALVIFQPELRAALAHLGQSPLSRFFGKLGDPLVAQEITKVAERLSHARVGAIIVIEREVPLTEYARTGTVIDAHLSAELLEAIFTPPSPLHDGAVILRGDTVVAAGCILPVSQAPLADRTLGTRHRAALGVSEESDALVIVVSEETGTISVVHAARIVRGLASGELGTLLGGDRVEATGDHAAIEVGA